jgi:hypothetical protein
MADFYTYGEGYDTHLSYGQPDSTHDTSYTLECSTYTWLGSYAREFPLMYFNLSSLTGKLITGATLYITGSGSGIVHTTEIIFARILPANSSVTNSATWNYADGSSVRWAGDSGGDGGQDAGCSVPGVDFSSTPLASVIYRNEGGYVTTANLDLTEVRNMVSDNYGIIAYRPTSSAYPGHIASGDHPTVSYRPKLTVTYIEGEFFIGNYGLPAPTSIEIGTGDNLTEFNKIANARDITVGSSYYYIYKLSWDILNKSELSDFEDARAQSMPVAVSDIAGIINTTGFVLDYRVKTENDSPPRYKVDMLIESDRLT